MGKLIMINAQNHLLILNGELKKVRTSLLSALSNSSNLLHHSLVETLKQNNPEHWLELTDRQLGNEYRSLIIRLEQLEAAVCQVDIGQYGYCCDCEEKIDSQRLNADPTIQRCASCEPKIKSN